MRGFDEDLRTAYMRYLGDHWPLEREAVGKGMLDDMSVEERKAAWAQRKVMGEVC